MLDEPAVRARAGRPADRAAGPGRQPERGELPARVPAGGRGGHRHRHVPVDLPHRRAAAPTRPSWPAQDGERDRLSTSPTRSSIIVAQPVAAQLRRPGAEPARGPRQQPRRRHQDACPTCGCGAGRTTPASSPSSGWWAVRSSPRWRSSLSTRPAAHRSPPRVGRHGRRSRPGRARADRPGRGRRRGSPTVRSAGGVGRARQRDGRPPHPRACGSRPTASSSPPPPDPSTTSRCRRRPACGPGSGRGSTASARPPAARSSSGPAPARAAALRGRGPPRGRSSSWSSSPGCGSATSASAVLTRLVQLRPRLDAFAGLPAPPWPLPLAAIGCWSAARWVVVVAACSASAPSSRPAGRPARPQAAGVPECNGEASLCDVPLEPGHVRGEPQRHVVGALPGLAVRRADEHAHRPARRRRPGPAHRHPLRGAVHGPPPRLGDAGDHHRPGRRAGHATGRQLRPGHRREGPAGGGQRPAQGRAPSASIYLCHNFCEMGAASFTDQMVAVRKLARDPPRGGGDRSSSRTTPTPADTSAALAGRGARRPGMDPRPDPSPCPTLGDLVDAGQERAGLRRERRSRIARLVPVGLRVVPGDALRLEVGRRDDLCPEPGRGGQQAHADQPLGRLLAARSRQGRQRGQHRGRARRPGSSSASTSGGWCRTWWPSTSPSGVRSCRWSSRSTTSTRSSLRDDPRRGRQRTRPTPPTRGRRHDDHRPSTPVGSTSSAFVAPTVITSLTGGDPQAFCAGTGPLLDVMSGLGAGRSLEAHRCGRAAGADLRARGRPGDAQPARPPPPRSWLASCRRRPTSRRRRSTPSARRGSTRPRSTPWPTRSPNSCRAPTPTGAVAEQLVVDQLDAKLGRDGTIALAKAFDRAHPPSGAVFDLGDVSTEVATSSGLRLPGRG